MVNNEQCFFCMYFSFQVDLNITYTIEVQVYFLRKTLQ